MKSLTLLPAGAERCVIVPHPPDFFGTNPNVVFFGTVHCFVVAMPFFPFFGVAAIDLEL